MEREGTRERRGEDVERDKVEIEGERNYRSGIESNRMRAVEKEWATGGITQGWCQYTRLVEISELIKLFPGELEGQGGWGERCEERQRGHRGNI